MPDPKYARSSHEKGSYYEKAAAKYLKRNGYEIIQMNYRCKIGEIDIVAKDCDVLVFAEVKYRSEQSGLIPAYSVHRKKQHKIISCAKWYIMENGLSLDAPMRFDVISIQGGNLKVYKNAYRT